MPPLSIPVGHFCRFPDKSGSRGTWRAQARMRMRARACARRCSAKVCGLRVCVFVENLEVSRDLQGKLTRIDSSLSRGCRARCFIELGLDADRIVRQDGQEVTLLSGRIIARLCCCLNRMIGNYAGCQNHRERRVKDCRIPRGRVKDAPVVGAIPWIRCWIPGTILRISRMAAWCRVSSTRRRCCGSRRTCRKTWRVMDNVCSPRCPTRVSAAIRRCR